MRHFEICNWARYQHYKDRDPTWLKLHRSLLSDYQWAKLPDVSKGQLMGLWLVAARCGNFARFRVLPARWGAVLAARRGRRWDANLAIILSQQRGHVAAVAASQGNHGHVPVMGGLDGLDHVGRVATGGDGEQHVAGLAEGADLL